jgi:hypothetical protein
MPEFVEDFSLHCVGLEKLGRYLRAHGFVPITQLDEDFTWAADAAIESLNRLIDRLTKEGK